MHVMTDFCVFSMNQSLVVLFHAEITFLIGLRNVTNNCSIVRYCMHLTDDLVDYFFNLFFYFFFKLSNERMTI